MGEDTFLVAKGSKGSSKFSCTEDIYWGTVLISKVFLENYPLLSLACEHRCISAVERI